MLLIKVGLTDFGFATPFTPEGARCTLAYAAPEIIQYVLDTRVRRAGGKAYTSACDCWSLGAVLYFCLSGSMPFTCKGDNVLTADLTNW
jgi:serine/threonine protein kinase